MSQLYTDLPKTTFPTSEQAFPVMLDIAATDGKNVKGFQEAMMAGNTELARVYYAQIENANQKFVTAELMNNLFQTCVALQRFWQSDIQGYVTGKQAEWQAVISEMDYKGAFDVNTQYKKDNYIEYSGLIYIAIANPPIGAYPTNTAYWRVLTVKGQTGESGQGMSFTGDWVSTQAYALQDVVSYDNALWGAIQANTNQIPAEGSAYWQLIYRATRTVYPVQAETPTGQAAGELWFEVAD